MLSSHRCSHYRGLYVAGSIRPWRMTTHDVARAAFGADFPMAVSGPLSVATSVAPFRSSSTLRQDHPSMSRELVNSLIALPSPTT